MTQIFIVSGTSWTVPADWSSANTVEVIGGGAGGGTQSGSNQAGGGGGGGYAKATNLAGLGSAVTIQVGGGGAAATAGGQTWFNGATAAAASVGVNGGGANSGVIGGAGGTVINGAGSSGGAGGSSTNNGNGGMGGGGAGGPNGAGQAGGGLNDAAPGSGGGGAGGGSSTPGSLPLSGTQNGGQGGTAQDATAGGGGGVLFASDAGAGAHGSGGGGGAYAGVTSETYGAPGGNGVEWNSTHGAGGGGGGGGLSFSGSGGSGGNGGLYGGGGGSGTTNGFAVGGSGGQGIIVINYTPAAGATITADASTAAEFRGSQHKDDPVAIEFGLTVPCDVRSPLETGDGVRARAASPVAVLDTGGSHLRLPTEFAGAVAVTADILARLEFAANLRAGAIAPPEWASRNIREGGNGAEWGSRLATAAGTAGSARLWLECSNAFAADARSSHEILASVSFEGLLVLEALTSAVRISIALPACLEWADPPPLPLISPERLLRSPGRIRILAGLGSIHPLRGQ
jgi:hypothetical protein